MIKNAMLIQHFNERPQVPRYNFSNLLLQVSAVGFLAGSFAVFEFNEFRVQMAYNYFGKA